MLGIYCHLLTSEMFDTERGQQRIGILDNLKQHQLNHFYII